MRLYHITTLRSALIILLDGFRDGAGYYGTDSVWRGVWLSDVPLDQLANEDHAVLAVDFDLPLGDLATYEWIEEGNKGYREWLIPAEVIASKGKIRMLQGKTGPT